MQKERKRFSRWETCVRCDRRCRKIYHFGRQDEMVAVLCRDCSRAITPKNHGRIYPSRRSVERGYAIRSLTPANR